MPIIKNYGFLWDRDQIYRGAGSNPGHLKGDASGHKTIDFREQIGVYVLYDSNQRIVYVGQSCTWGKPETETPHYLEG
jgi:hypothetical protein